MFQPIAGDHASGTCEIFADGFAGAKKTPEGAKYRPSGWRSGRMGRFTFLTTSRDGFIESSTRAIRGSAPKATPCPSISAPAGEVVASSGQPPES